MALREKAIHRLALACAHYNEIGQFNTPDPLEAASYFNWIVMGAPTSAAMLLGDAGIPDRDERHRHATESVRIFLCAYGVSAPDLS
ncbi:TetR/AcrR family transcriptional regulator C-terminal domain-containing protein [Rhodobacteraceae bacterium 2376]|uniref:TetR/AcrR family transcriptional regulator C-terminal domain-containing protein n=1 Tax=Rhabdonatronobacter sediminivivens TaxID=2743469 RepID=A0A7Z0L009_9RHOB|nr:TetR/AcrR family transcriptional regulator C-terminal domain-containing protein [Rhabdonatronobacter sediminivivens]NYS26944.1 TetR/AcrR family transcriptional regulator C-terminal domain-containing protein [Rhabdonatronobacter sediminivivens]